MVTTQTFLQTVTKSITAPLEPPELAFRCARSNWNFSRGPQMTRCGGGGAAVERCRLAATSGRVSPSLITLTLSVHSHSMCPDLILQH